jgi:serine/threonine protein kinase
MEVVYRAHDEVLHRDVALRVVNKGGVLDTSASQNLLHEARASSSLAHPNICTIYEVGETEGDLYWRGNRALGKFLLAQFRNCLSKNPLAPSLVGSIVQEVGVAGRY